MYEQGIGYPDIAQQLNCHVTTLRKELKKRGLWKGLSAEQLRVQRVKNASEKWDGLCKQAVILHEKGMSYTEIQ
ncbi:helix-turn-helix domain-containing protein, partial [Escherichia sp. SS-MK2]